MTVEIEDGQGLVEVAETVEPVAAPEQDYSQTETPSEGHPAWAPFKDSLDPLSFHKVQPILTEYDRAAQARITEVNSRFEPWKTFHEAGVTPDNVNEAFRILQQMEANPREFYERLGAHLSETGQLPQIAQEPAGSQADPFEDEDPKDAALRELQERVEAQDQFLRSQVEAQQTAEANARADAALTQEFNSLKASRPNMTREEEGEIIQRAYLYAQAGQQKPLAEVAAEFDSFRNRILQTPRPTDLAPRLPGAGGTAPTGNHQQKAPSEYSRSESKALLADMIRKGQSGS